MSRHVKSRSGCRVCKAKRLKCDETAPACRNCVNRGIACPGYRQVLRWSTKYETGYRPKEKKGAAITASVLSASASASTRTGNNTNTAAGTTTTFTATSPVPQFSQLATAASRSLEPPPDPGPPVQLQQPLPQTSALPQTHDAHSISPSYDYILSPTASSSSSSGLSASTGLLPYESVLTLPDVTAVAAVTAQDWLPGLFDEQPGLLPSPPAAPASASAASLFRTFDTENGWQDVLPDWQMAHTFPDVSPGLQGFQPFQGVQGFPFGDYQVFPHGSQGMNVIHGLQGFPYQQDTEADPDTALAAAYAATTATTHPARGLALPGLALVELWFQSVCGMWAAWDSAANPFRRVCGALWSSSEAVFFAMQTMAAASLPRQPASVRAIVRDAPQRSTQALIGELQRLFAGVRRGSRQGRRSRGSIGYGNGAGHDQTTTPPAETLPFPAGLLTALFCMSSSLSWIDARQLGIQYLRNARSVIDLLDLHAARLAPADRDLLEFFRGCLLYEEMLRSVVTDDQEDIQALLAWTPDAATANTSTGLALHAWVGVPVALIGLFGQVMALCRRSRRHWRRTARATYKLLCQALLDIEDGRQLEARLLAIDLQALMPAGAHGDGSSPESALRSHLYTAAEVYRLSALLQLYQTFPDLAMKRGGQTTTDVSAAAAGDDRANPEEEAAPTGDDGGSSPATTSKLLLPLVLRIVDLLADIPASSPMRCLTPLLCICAGSGLRLAEDARNKNANKTENEAGGVDALGAPGAPPSDLGDLLLYGDMHSVWTGSGGVATAATATLSDNTTSLVLTARNALRLRLARLEQNLPPRPIAVARQLLETVWAAYDGGSKRHWLDIMAETAFESVFG